MDYLEIMETIDEDKSKGYSNIQIVDHLVMVKVDENNAWAALKLYYEKSLITKTEKFNYDRDEISKQIDSINRRRKND